MHNPIRLSRPRLAGGALALALCLLAGARPASAQLVQADFTGRTSTLKGPAFGPCCNTAFGGLTFRGPNISGTFIYDPSVHLDPGAVNVPLPVGTDDDPFHLVMGNQLSPAPFIFDAALALPTTVAQVQYNNGHFNGFAYFAQFLFEGAQYQLDIQGGQWSIYGVTNGFRDLSKVAASGSIDIGDANLTNIRPYVSTTATPEPASLVLLATGLLGIGGIARRRRTAA